MHWRNHSIIGSSQCFGHILAVAAYRPSEPGDWTQRPKFMRRKRLVRAKLARRMNDSAGRMIDDNQFDLIEVKHFPKLLGNSDLVCAIFRWERVVVAQREKFFRVGIDIA